MTAESSLFHALNDLFAMAEPLWSLLNDPRSSVVLALLAVFVARQAGGWRWLLAGLVAVMVSDLVTSRVLKPVIGRERPCAVEERVYVPTIDGAPHCGSGGAMPSAHAANSMALATALASPALTGVSLIVGLARVVAGQHWPSDVGAGWALGFAVGSAARFGFMKGLGWT